MSQYVPDSCLAYIETQEICSDRSNVPAVLTTIDNHDWWKIGKYFVMSRSHPMQLTVLFRVPLEGRYNLVLIGSNASNGQLNV